MNRVRPARSASGPTAEPAAPTEGVVVHGVGHAYAGLPVLAGVNLAVPRHGRVAVVGPSGGGKSTLLRLVAGLLEPGTGTVSVEGAADAAGRLARCALMPQRDLLLPWRSALDNAAIALENKGVRRAEARRRTRPLFERFGLGASATARPDQLSGGMRQRVSFVRTLVADKDVLLLDEPFGALDAISRADMQDWLLQALAELPRTVLLVTHDVEEALLLAEVVVVLSGRPGRVVHALPADFRRHDTRRATLADPGFVARRDEALAALERAG